MDRRIGALVLATGLALFGAHGVRAQQQSDEQQVKAANQAFYEAISAHDLERMDAVWAHEPYVRTIHPENYSYRFLVGDHTAARAYGGSVPTRSEPERP